MTSDSPYSHLSSIGDPRFSGGLTLYCNGKGGLTKVDTIDPVLEYKLSTSSCINGNNVLAQLREVFKDYADGPWYVDCINGIIYIHNSKFEDTPTDTYEFKAEPGEVLSVNISLQDKHEPRKDSQTSLYDQLRDTEEQLTVNTNSFYGDKNQSSSSSVENESIIPPENVYQGQVNWSDQFNQAKRAVAAQEDQAKQTVEGISRSVAAELQAKQYARDNMREASENPEVRADENASDFLRMAPNTPGLVTALKEAYTQGMLTSYQDNYYLVGNTPQTINPTTILPDGATPYQIQRGQTFFTPQANITLIGDDRFKYGPIVENKALWIYSKSSGSFGGTGRIFPGALEWETDRSNEYTKISAGGQFGSVGILRKDDIMRILAQAGDPEAQRIVNLQNRVDAIENYIKNMIKKTREKELTCSLTVVGKPSLGCSRNINLYNVGEHYSGVWYVKTCTHSLNASRGYITTLEMTFRKKQSSK